MSLWKQLYIFGYKESQQTVISHKAVGPASGSLIMLPFLPFRKSVQIILITANSDLLNCLYSITNLTIHSTWSKHAYINFFWHFHGCLLLSVKFQFINFLLLYYYISKSLTIKFILLTSIKIELFANFQFMKFFFYYCNTENLYQQLHPFFKLFFKIKSRYHL